MSLIVYGGSKPPATPPEQQLYSVVIKDQHINTLVIHNRETNEVTLASPVDYPYDIPDPSFQSIKCPHCGAMFQEARHSPSPTRHNSTTATTISLPDTVAEHGNYFRLLEDTFRLPDTLFTQGYFDKFFKQLSLVGRGSRGSVYKVEHILNGVSLGTFALKKITIGEDPAWLSKILKEVHMLVKISCNTQHLVNYNHVWLEVDRINEFGPRVPCAFILQQYCSGGNLEDLIMRLKKPKLTVKEMKKYKVRKLKGRLLSNEEILIMFTSLVKGVAELHRNHIIHRDLKPSNCLLSGEYLDKFEQEPDLAAIPDVLIGDFGESQLEGEKRSGTGSTGTLEYTAPELLDVGSVGNIHQFNKKTDVYSLGMILVYMCYGEVPFKNSDITELKGEIISGMALEKREDLLPGFIEIINNLTSHNQDERMDIEQLVEELYSLDSQLHPKDRRLSLAEVGPPPLVPFEKHTLLEDKLKVVALAAQLTALYLLFIKGDLTTGPMQLPTYALMLLTGASYTWDIQSICVLLVATIAIGVISMVL